MSPSILKEGAQTHLNGDRSLLVPVTDERMIVRFALNFDPTPFKLLDVNECLVDVWILCYKIGSYLNCKELGVKNMDGGFGMICSCLSNSLDFRWLGMTHSR